MQATSDGTSAMMGMNACPCLPDSSTCCADLRRMASLALILRAAGLLALPLAAGKVAVGERETGSLVTLDGRAHGRLLAHSEQPVHSPLCTARMRRCLTQSRSDLAQGWLSLPHRCLAIWGGYGVEGGWAHIRALHVVSAIRPPDRQQKHHHTARGQGGRIMGRCPGEHSMKTG
jgi:hypothetical protein